MITIKIELQKSQVVLSPENDEEKAKLTALWKVLVDCVGDSRKLVPVGEYVPQKGKQGASFHIEGLDPQDSSFVEVKAEHDVQVYCRTCNKLLSLKAGEVIPVCCGKMMSIID